MVEHRNGDLRVCQPKIKIHFVNNAGGGYAEVVEVREGITIDEFVEECAGNQGKNPIIRVNRETVGRNDILEDEDRVTITPSKIDGFAGL